ncbi:MAG: glycosyltransferase family 39 protein [Desulfobaccales bacterium]
MTRPAPALLVCLLLAAFLAFPGLGRRPLYSAGEVRVALIAKEMVERGDYLVPRLNGVRYYEKPPLMYWAVAGSYLVFGVNEFAARFPAALAYVGTVAVVFFLGFTLWGLRGAWLAALIFLTTPAAYHLGRFVSLDALLTFGLSLSLLGLARLFPREEEEGSRFWGPCLFWLGAALAALTKGLIGLVFPLATAGVAALWHRQGSSWRRLRPGLGLAVVAVVFLPWHLALAWRDSDFVPYYLLNEHIYRFLNLRVPLDYERLSIPAFWAAAALWFFPWSLLLPGLLRRPPAHATLPLIYAVLILGFFTLSRCRLEYYGHPAYPALAVALAGYVLALQEQGRGRLALGLPSLLLGILGALVGGLYVFHPDITGEITYLVMTLDGYYREYFTKHPEQGFFFAREAEGLALPFAAAWLLAGIGGAAAAWRRRPEVAVLIWVLAAFPAAYALEQGTHLVSRDRSQKEAARLIEQHWEEGARLIVAGTYEDMGGVTFYTGRRTEMHRATEGDLLYGWQRGDTPELFLTEARLLQVWHSPARVFLLLQVEIPSPEPAWVLLETPRHRLLTNRPLSRSPDQGLQGLE